MADEVRVALERVTSSNLSAVGYDEQRRLLAVQFKNGQIFQYADVPASVATEFVTAGSLGRFYTHNIRGKYAGALLTGECDKCGGYGYVGDTCTDCGCSTFQAKPYTPKPAAVLHWLDYDAPRGKVRRAACRELVRESVTTTDRDRVTCAECVRALEEQDGMTL